MVSDSLMLTNDGGGWSPCLHRVMVLAGHVIRANGGDTILLTVDCTALQFNQFDEIFIILKEG